MKSKRIQSGFTLIELLVAMAITVILLGVLVYMTGISMDTYKDSRNEVRASRQAKEATDVLAKDFESMISRRDGNNFGWLYAGQEPRGLEGTARGNNITNASQLVFFTGATDRYHGEIGNETVDKGGDVSAVCYRLVYRDQISGSDDDRFKVFSLYRHLVNPDEAFGLDGNKGLLAQDDLETAYTALFDDGDDLTAGNFLVENIYEFTVTFIVEYKDSNGVTKLKRVSITEDGDYQEFRLKGNEILAEGSGGTPDDDLRSGILVGVDVSISVITDQGMVIAKNSPPETWKNKLAPQYTYHYTKSINVPRP